MLQIVISQQTEQLRRNGNISRDTQPPKIE